ncbi:MAG: HAMP domain-containing protein [Planctomycetes bacterium]|nr:HAMP domain-containing protein [Planctomycetota bacterium]
MRDPLHSLSVRLKLPLLVAGVCLLAFGVGGTIVSTSARDALEAEILQRLDAECRASADALDAELTLLTRRVQDFASDGYVRDRLDRVLAADRSAAAELRDHLARNKLPLVAAFHELAVQGPDGHGLVAVRAAADRLLVPGLSASDALDAPWHSDRLQGSAALDAPQVVIAVPVEDLAGQRRLGRLLAFVPIDAWIAAARVVDARRMRVATSAVRGALHLTDRAGARSDVGASESPPDHAGRSTFARSLVLPINGWQLHTEVDAEQALAPVSGLQSRFLAAGVLLAALSGGLLFFPMRFLVAPLQALQLAAQRLAAGDLTARVAVASSDEVGGLASAFNAMADALADRTSRIEHANAALRDSKRELVAERDRLNAVLASMRDAVVLVGPDGEVILRNAAAAPLVAPLLSRASELAGRHRCYAEGARDGDCATCLLDPGATARACLVDVAGATFEMQAVPVTALPGGPPGRLLVARDVSDRIERDLQMIHQERLAALGEVAAVMAHELNNPLAAISMFQQLLRDALPADSPHREAIDAIGRSTTSCRQAIRELLDYTTGAQAEVAEVALNDAVEGAARFVEPLAKRSRVEVVHRLAPEQPTLVGDEVQLRQLFVNLALNAVQAIGGAGGSGRVALEVAVVDGQARVAVIDDGPGIPDPVRPRLFQPFFTTKRRGAGTGLGLATARRIAELHGGRVELESSRPGRTVFQVSFGPRRADAFRAGAPT